MWLKLIICNTLLVLSVAEKVSYDNFGLYKVIPEAKEHLDFLNDLVNSCDGLDFWNIPARIGEFVNVIASPEQKENLGHSLKKRSIQAELMLENIQEAFDAQLLSRRKRDTSRQLYWSNYQTIEEIYDWFDYLAENYGDLVTVVTVGQSHEGRNITGVKISRSSSRRRTFFLQGGEVAADWLSPTVLTYIIDQLVRGTSEEARAALDDFEWHIFPIVNPDGHQFTQDSDRLWLKNRRPTTSNTIGVDLTKNWNTQWSVSGGSLQPAASNYIGLGPFSEPETRAVSRYIEDVGGWLTGFLSFKGFGQKLILPFAHSSEPLSNYNEMLTVGRRAMGSLAVRYGTQYTVGLSRLIDDGATGNVLDWVKYRFNPPIAATYHLRDNGTWGYTLPVIQIQPTCEETFDSILAIIREARNVDVI